MQEPIQYCIKNIHPHSITFYKSVSDTKTINIPSDLKVDLNVHQKEMIDRFKGLSSLPNNQSVEIYKNLKGYINLVIGLPINIITIPLYTVEAWVPVKNSKWITEYEVKGFNKSGNYLGDDFFDTNFIDREIKPGTVMFIVKNEKGKVTHKIVIMYYLGVIPELSVTSLDFDGKESSMSFFLQESDVKNIFEQMIENLKTNSAEKKDKQEYLVHFDDSIMYIPCVKTVYHVNTNNP